MVDENQTACACLRVTDKPEQLGGGLQRSRWLCQDCGRGFIPQPHSCTDHPKVKALVEAATEAVNWMDPEDSQRLRTALDEVKDA